MNIIFLVRLYYPHIGGVERHVQGLVKHLSKDNKITIITEKHTPELPDEEVIAGARVIRIPVVGVGESDKKWTIWKWMQSHFNLLNEADVIHIHDIMFWLYPYKLLHPFRKIFITFHGWEGIYPIPLKNRLQKKIDCLLSSANICVGDYLAKWYGIKPDFVTYGACYPPNLTTHSTPHHPLRLLFLGRLAPDTGFSECLELFNRYKVSIGWQLTVAGDGPLRSSVPAAAKFLGFIADPYAQINQADYVFCTGFMGILESWSCSKPVFAAYTNPVKRDYLLMHPLSKYLTFDNHIPQKSSPEAYNWARKQTWAKLAAGYLQVWSK